MSRAQRVASPISPLDGSLGYPIFHTIEPKTILQEGFLPPNHLIAIPFMTRDLHYVFGDTKLARLEALLQRYGQGGMGREVWEERYAKRDSGKMGPKWLR